MAPSGKPPLSNSPAGSAGSKSRQSSTSKSGDSSSKKSRKHNSSDSPSASANSEHGVQVLYKNVRSVLSHPLGLPLVCAFNEDSVYATDSLSEQITAFVTDCTRPKGGDQWDSILTASIQNWRVGGGKRDEKALTQIVSNVINDKCASSSIKSEYEKEMRREDENGKNKRFGALDIVVSSKADGSNKSGKENTPLAIMEFGLNMEEWWSKLDQLTKYLSRMFSHPQDDLHFHEPVLFAVATIHDGKEAKCKLRLGVFLCTPKDDSDFRMSLLWRSETETLTESSDAFGKLMQVTSTFARYRDKGNEFFDKYEYYSSNCCRIGENMVFRSYDTRVRTTDRSEAIYVDQKCHSIVGDGTKMVVSLGRPNGKTANAVSENPIDGASTLTTLRTNFWKFPGMLKVITTPYRSGRHYATRPRNFIPIIDQLVELHNLDYVHGDIRAFNTVFSDKNEDEGWLIDFDFGGKAGKTNFPNGYRTSLDDGIRIGEDNTPIEKWHDWFALGKLIFSVHRFCVPPGATMSFEFLQIQHYWDRDIDTKVPEASKIKELKDELLKIDEQGWQVLPSVHYGMLLERITKKIRRGTKAEATGSPPQK